MNRSGIETYELLRLDEVTLAGYFDLEDTRFEEWYEKNRAVGDRLYSAILDRKIDLVAFRGTEDGRYYSILTRSPKQEGSLQLTDIDSKGPIGHRRLTNQKMLDLPGYGAVLAAVPDISKCNERDILQAIGFTQKGDRSLKEKVAIGREGSKQLEAAIARLKNPKNDRYKELYLQNRGIGEKVYNAVLSGRLDLACFCGDSSKYYSVLTRSTRQDGALQVTEIDRKGPIGHRLLTGPKQLELPGCGATVAAVSDVSRCTEQEILDAVGFKMQQGLNSKAVKCKAGHQRLDAERTKTDLPKERKSPAR